MSPDSYDLFYLVENESATQVSLHLQTLKCANEVFFKQFLNQRNSKKQTALHVACQKLHVDKTQVLLESGANPNLLDKDKQTPALLVVVGLQTCHCDECHKKALQCLAMLSYYNGSLGIPDAEGRTALSLCAESRFADCAKAIILHACNQRKQTISSVLINPQTGKSILDLLAQRIPTVLETILDCAMKPKGNVTMDDPNYQVKFDLRFLVCNYTSCKEVGEMSFLKTLLKNADRGHKYHELTSSIWRHPVVEVFMDIKWYALERWYITFLVYQILALLAYTTFTCLNVFQYCPYEKYAELAKAPVHTISSTPEENLPSCSVPLQIQILAFLLIANSVFVLYHDLRRGYYEFQVYRKNLFHYFNILGNLAVIFTAIVIVALDPSYYVYGYFYPMSAFAVSILWCQTFVQICRLPRFAIYVEMLVKISTDFLKTLSIYSFFLVGFAISFCILFVSEPKAYHILLSISKLLSMLVGELDHESLLSQSITGKSEEIATNSSSPVERTILTERWIVSFVWYMGTVVMITLILMNLLVGLAVSDIQRIRDNAEILAIKRRIRFVAYIEKLFVTVFRVKSSTNYSWVANVVYPLEQRLHSVTVFPNNPEYKEVSNKTKRAIKRRLMMLSGESNMLRKCKGCSPDSGQGMKKRQQSQQMGSFMKKLSVSQQPIGFQAVQPAHVSDTERIKKLERCVGRLEHKLDGLIEIISQNY